MRNFQEPMSVYIGKNIIRIDEVESTNILAKEILKLDEKVINGSVIISGRQKEGRGYGTNKWESENGKNLTFSIILYPDFVPPEEQFNISRAVSLGIYEYLKTLFDKVSIKWPNDIYIGDRKIAGILIENALSGNMIASSVIGIGLNVNQVVFRSDAPNPTSMKLRGAKDFDLENVLKTLLVFIENRLLQLETNRSYEINNDYIKALYRLNEYHNFEDDNKTFCAKIIDVADCGDLILETKEGKRTNYKFKEVTFLI